MTRKASRTLDLAMIRDAMSDGKVWACTGFVYLPEGETSHYEIDPGDAETRPDVIVSVTLAPNGEPASCRLAQTNGLWRIPPVGAEVAVLVPQGDYEWDPIIVGEVGALASPTTAGLSDTAVVLIAPAAGEVLIHDGTGAQAVPLATLADLEGLRAYVASQFHAAAGHTHVCATPGNPTGAIVTVADNPAAAPTVAPPTPDGTTVLKAK